MTVNWAGEFLRSPVIRRFDASNIINKNEDSLGVEVVKRVDSWKFGSRACV